jgi:hypothetical protein
MGHSILVKLDLVAAYTKMAADRNRECEALEWCNALIGDVAGCESSPVGWAKTPYLLPTTVSHGGGKNNR